MSPVSPVFHTEATMSIGLKNVFRVVLYVHSHEQRKSTERGLGLVNCIEGYK